MSFHIFRKTPTGAGFVYEHEEVIALAGYQNGLIYSALTATNCWQQHRDEGRNTPLKWHLSACDLLALNHNPYEYAIVINLQPKADHLDYYELKDIWGFSYPDWTPIALRVERLLDNVCPIPNTDDYKWHFTDNNYNRIWVHEFLYLQGGYDGGDWKWPPRSPTNGAMLWPDALKFFLKKIFNWMSK
ncbi:MAG: hypothetical protein OXI94_17045 [Gemmatimonadota bacterium]|nr:hypothetical protein [Gemmatimonadota bacterium]MDE2829693.1 hypothetical protein [Gemmatimonadota bacterium]